MGLVDEAEFHFFHFFPYTDLPADHREYESLWVDFPNSNYDPQVGHDLYQRYLSEMVLADELGFDGLILNEHHNTQYSMNPAPNLTAAALIPQTKSWINVFGTPPNLGYPNRLAEEYAMLDVMSGGRLRIAFPLGTGMEYWANAVNPATARARFRESIDIILKCWTEDGPISYSGEFYTYRYLNPWPKPMQKPYPECYIVGTGSPETIELAAELGFGYSVVFIPTKVQLQVFDHFRERLAHHGHDPTPDKVTIGPVLAYVADSDEQAEEEFRPHVMYFFENALRTTPRYLNPPGYVTVPEFRKRIQAADVHGSANWDDLIALNRIVAGTPEKVADALGRWIEEAGSSRVNLNLTIGDMPNWKVVKNTTRFAEEVLPRLRATRQVTGVSDTTLTFERLAYDVNGTETVVLAAGDPSAPPLVFLHGAGTFHGFAFTEPWIEHHRVLVPYHPGYGESGDLPELREVHDLVLHYTALFDELGLTHDVDLVGFSLGGLLAARLAIEQKHRLRRLVLVAPAGLRVPGVEVDDLFGIPPEELMGRLAHHVETLLPHLPDDPHDVDFTVDRYREMRSTALMLWEHPFDRVVPRWLGRVDIPSLVVWGEEDRLLPVELAPAWAALLPDVTVKTFPDAGHLVLDESADAVDAVASSAPTT